MLPNLGEYFLLFRLKMEMPTQTYTLKPRLVHIVTHCSKKKCAYILKDAEYCQKASLGNTDRNRLSSHLR